MGIISLVICSLKLSGFYILWVHILGICHGYQKSTLIDNPCNLNQQYILGKDDTLHINSKGNQFFMGSCDITLKAEDSKYECTKLCFSVGHFNFETCDIRLKFYDSGVWNYGTAAASNSGDCNGFQRKDWCSSGKTATVRLENKKGSTAKMVGWFYFHLTSLAQCSDVTKSEPDSDNYVVETISEGNNVNVIVIVGVVLGCAVICLIMFIVLLVVFLKRRPYQRPSNCNNTYEVNDSQGQEYLPVQESCAGDNFIENSEDDERYTNLKTSCDRMTAPTAPPAEELCLQTDQRPPSYCSTPPSYSPKSTSELGYNNMV